MHKTIKALKTLLIVEIIIGLFGASFLALFVGVMATDSPSSTYLHMIGGGIFGFLIVFAPSVLLPYFSIRELKKYNENKKLFLNIFNSLLLLIGFLPLGVIHLILINKLNKELNDSLNNKINVQENTATSKINSGHIIFGFILLFSIPIILKVVSSQLDKQSELIIDCGKEKIFTKKRSSKKLYFADKTSLYLHRNNYTSLGFREGNTITITNPYIIEKATKCIERTNSQYSIEIEENNSTR